MAAGRFPPRRPPSGGPLRPPTLSGHLSVRREFGSRAVPAARLSTCCEDGMLLKFDKGGFVAKLGDVSGGDPTLRPANANAILWRA